MKFNTACAALCLSLFSRAATASVIDNPGNYVWDDGWGDLQFNRSGTTITRTLAASSGSLDTDLDSAGGVIFNTFTIHSVVIAPYTVLVQVVTANSSGLLKASVGGYNTLLSLQLKIKITGNSLPATCVTSPFTASFEGAYSYTAGTDQGDLSLYSGTGGTVGGTTGWLTVPALGAVCGGQHGTINSLLGFGGATQGLNVQRLGAVTVPGPQGH